MSELAQPKMKMRFGLEDLRSFILRLFTRGAIKIDLQQGFELARHLSDPHAPRSSVYFNLRGRNNPGQTGTLGEGDLRRLAWFMACRLDQFPLKFDGLLP